MAQEEENRYPNVCVPHTPLIREAGQPQDKDILLRVCLSAPACLLSRVPNRGVLQEFLPDTDRRSRCDNQFSRNILGEKTQRRQGGRAR